MAAVTSWTYQWAHDLTNHLELPPERSFPPALMFAFTLGSALSCLCNLVLWAATGTPTPAMVPTSLMLPAALAGGALTDALGTLFNRKAILGSPSLAVQTAAFLIPAMATSWLFLTGFTRVDSPAIFSLGTATVLFSALAISRKKDPAPATQL